MCDNADFCYAECYKAECHMSSVVMLSAVMPSVIMLSVIMLRVIMLSAKMLSAIMLSVIATFQASIESSFLPKIKCQWCRPNTDFLYAQCHYAECHYAECHYADSRVAFGLTTNESKFWQNFFCHRKQTKIKGKKWGRG